MSAALRVKVKEKPILFSGPMIRAILEGRKTQTRRVITNERIKVFAPGYADDRERIIGMCPYGRVGDRLWVRETFTFGDTAPSDAERNRRVVIFRADCPDHPEAFEKGNGGPGWVPGIFMPRERSRLTLEITNIRVERLQEISCNDVLAEGSLVPLREHSNPELGIQCVSAKEWFQEGWDSLNAKRGYSWESNPLVWVIEFRKL